MHDSLFMLIGKSNNGVILFKLIPATILGFPFLLLSFYPLFLSSKFDNLGRAGM